MVYISSFKHILFKIYFGRKRKQRQKRKKLLGRNTKKEKKTNYYLINVKSFELSNLEDNVEIECLAFFKPDFSIVLPINEPQINVNNIIPSNISNKHFIIDVNLSVGYINIKMINKIVINIAHIKCNKRPCIH
ncbi:unnamed protein product [Schistosoma mattheei]|uniref:Uncharacterized protein n=1 Tax=Schistosoma mattheei TaxID=31246 RepID=A0A183PST9_9TREM|nr:unnamed protein product [Schistosoma mattheei]